MRCYETITYRLSRASGWEKLLNASRQALSSNTLSNLATFPVDWPEIELLPIAAAAPYASIHDSDAYASIQCAVLVPSSRGNVTIASSNNYDHPVINLNLLPTRSDRELIIEAFKRARQLAQASDTVMGAEASPGDTVQTDDQTLQWLRETAVTVHHASATCKIPTELVRSGC